tara:strand:- start:193 stop:615 length:423 start_codon:yes stop_codon:yes gene_type:complete
MNFSELLSNLTIHYNALIRQAALLENLSSSQALHLISIPSDGISMTSLSKKLGLDTSTLTRNVQNLEKNKLIKKYKDVSDKRIQKIYLTQNGINKCNNLKSKLNKINEITVENLSFEQQEVLLDSLEQLSWSIDCLRENI